MASELPVEREYEITFGALRAVVSDGGASLRRLERHEDGAWCDVAWGYSRREERKGGQGDVLIPFPGRIPGGRYRFAGSEYQLERNDKEGPNAIHGFVRGLPWRARREGAGEVAFSCSIDEAEFSARGYPFSLESQVRYRVDAHGFTCEFRVRNAGRNAAPLGVGFHPYFTVGTDLIDAAEVRIPAREVLEFGPGLLPTGRVLPVPEELDFRRPRTVGATVLNTCYRTLERDADGLARAVLRHPVTGRTVTVWIDRAFDYLVVYSGDAIAAPHARRALAIEPMTCGTDAFNRPEWGLIRLEPGGEASGSWGVEA